MGREGLGAMIEVRAVLLVGDPRHYERFGFRLTAPPGFAHAGSPAFDPALQVRELATGALGGLRGPVHFHPALAAFGTG